MIQANNWKHRRRKQGNMRISKCTKYNIRARPFDIWWGAGLCNKNHPSTTKNIYPSHTEKDPYYSEMLFYMPFCGQTKYDLEPASPPPTPAPNKCQLHFLQKKKIISTNPSPQNFNMSSLSCYFEKKCHIVGSMQSVTYYFVKKCHLGSI